MHRDTNWCDKATQVRGVNALCGGAIHNHSTWRMRQEDHEFEASHSSRSAMVSLVSQTEKEEKQQQQQQNKADIQPQRIYRYLRSFFYRDDRRWRSAQRPGRLWECGQGEVKGQGLGRQTCEPKDIDSPHPRPSEVPSSTPSPQSIDQTQNRKPRAMSSCCLPPPPQALNLAKSVVPSPRPVLAWVLAPAPLPGHLWTASACLSVSILPAWRSCFPGPFP